MKGKIMGDTDAQWQILCDQHEAARDAFNRAFVPVNKKFVAIGEGKSSANPTIAELEEFERTRAEWEDVKRKMLEFVKANV